MRLIDADALGIGYANPDVFQQTEYAMGWNAAVKLVMNAPTIDAVPVVWCMDCKRRGSEICPMRYEEYCGYGIELNDFTQDDGFCMYGQKKD